MPGIMGPVGYKGIVSPSGVVTVCWGTFG